MLKVNPYQICNAVPLPFCGLPGSLMTVSLCKQLVFGFDETRVCAFGDTSEKSLPDPTS